MVDSHRHPVLIAHQRKMALSRIQSLKIGLIIVLFPLASLSCRKHAPGPPPEEKKSAGLPGKTVVHARLESMAEVPNPLITPYIRIVWSRENSGNLACNGANWTGKYSSPHSEPFVDGSKQGCKT